MRQFSPLAILGCTLWLSACGGNIGSIPIPTPTRAPATWDVRQVGNVLEIAYGRASDYPQFAALHLDSGYLRMIPRRDSGWGTSVVLSPSFWSNGHLNQGASLSFTHRQDGERLVLDLQGIIGELGFSGIVAFSPPEETFVATVAMATSGTVLLDRRPAEAFKPVFLSSMRVSPDVWDATAAQIDDVVVPLPDDGWIVQPAVWAQNLGLIGGTSAWKSNAPTVRIRFFQPMAATGWVARRTDPNDDNIALWVASDTVLTEWSYSIVAE